MFKNEKFLARGAAIVWALIYGVIVAAFFLNPDSSLRETVTTVVLVSTIPLLYIVSRFFLPRMAAQDKNPDLGRREGAGSMPVNATLNASMIAAGGLLFATLSIGYIDDFGLIGGADGETLRRRVSGVFMGLIFLLMGNYMPKIVKPITEASCNPAVHQAFQRQVGWTFFIAGLVYLLSWIFLERGLANTVSTAAMMVCLLLFVPRLAWFAYKMRRNTASRAAGADRG